MEEVKPIPALEPRQKRFCDEYLKDMNATAAARQAGYSFKSAHNTGYKLLLLPQVKEYIIQVQKRIAGETAVAARVMGRELVEIAFADPADFVDENGDLKNVSQIPAHLRRAVQIQTKKVRIIGQVTTSTTYHLNNQVPIMEKFTKRFELKDNHDNPFEDRSNWPTAVLGDGTIVYI